MCHEPPSLSIVAPSSGALGHGQCHCPSTSSTHNIPQPNPRALLRPHPACDSPSPHSTTSALHQLYTLGPLSWPLFPSPPSQLTVLFSQVLSLFEPSRHPITATRTAAASSFVSFTFHPACTRRSLPVTICFYSLPIPPSLYLPINTRHLIFLR